MADEVQALLSYDATATHVVNEFNVDLRRSLSFITDGGVAVIVSLEPTRLVVQTDHGGAPTVLYVDQDLSLHRLKLAGHVRGPAHNLPSLVDHVSGHGDIVDRFLLRIWDYYVEFDVATDHYAVSAVPAGPWTDIDQGPHVSYRGFSQLGSGQARLTDHGLFTFHQAPDSVIVQSIDDSEEHFILEGARLARVSDYYFAVGYPTTRDRVHVYDYNYQLLAVTPLQTLMSDGVYLRSGDAITNLPTRVALVLPPDVTPGSSVVTFQTNPGVILYTDGGPLLVTLLDGGVVNQLTIEPFELPSEAPEHQLHFGDDIIRFLRHDDARQTVQVVEIRYNITFETYE